MVSSPRVPHKADSVQEIDQFGLFAGSALGVHPSTEFAVQGVFIGNAGRSVFLLVVQETLVHVHPRSLVDDSPLKINGLQEFESIRREFPGPMHRSLLIDPPPELVVVQGGFGDARRAVVFLLIDEQLVVHVHPWGRLQNVPVKAQGFEALEAILGEFSLLVFGALGVDPAKEFGVALVHAGSPVFSFEFAKELELFLPSGVSFAERGLAGRGLGRRLRFDPSSFAVRNQSRSLRSLLVFPFAFVGGLLRVHGILSLAGCCLGRWPQSKRSGREAAPMSLPK